MKKKTPAQRCEDVLSRTAVVIQPRKSRWETSKSDPRTDLIRTPKCSSAPLKKCYRLNNYAILH